MSENSTEPPWRPTGGAPGAASDGLPDGLPDELPDLVPNPFDEVHRPPGGQAVLYQAENRYLKLLASLYGQRFLDYRAAWSAAAPGREVGDFPLSLDLAVNSGCGLSCLMCPLPNNPKDRRYAPMPEALYLSLMAQAKEHALPALTLGLASEPLLNPSIPRYIALADRAGLMDIRLGTNGQALDRTLIERLLDCGLTRLEISLDAVRPETYRQIRRGGELYHLERAIDLFLEGRTKRKQKLPLLRLSFLILPQNQAELAPFVERWSGAADLLSLQQPIWFPGTGLEKPGPQNPPAPRAFCQQPWQRLGLDWLGRAWPCCSWYGRGLLPLEAQTTPVSDIWLSADLKVLRQAHLDGRLPRTCQLCADSGAF